MEVVFDRQEAVKLSGIQLFFLAEWQCNQVNIVLSKKKIIVLCCLFLFANFQLFSFHLSCIYYWVRNYLDVRELAVLFGCVGFIPFVCKSFSL